MTEQPERPSFTDVKPGDWFYETVQTANELGLMKGNGDGTFAPSQGLTRAQLVMALSNYAKADLPEAVGSVFTDVARTAWYGPAVAWAAENGYVNGYEDGSFRPDAIVTREQLCCVLGRYLRSQNISASAAGVSFTDDASISGYARQDVAYCAALGLVSGMPDGRFAPANGATRAETAAILVRMVGLG